MTSRPCNAYFDIHICKPPLYPVVQWNTVVEQCMPQFTHKARQCFAESFTVGSEAVSSESIRVIVTYSLHPQTGRAYGKFSAHVVLKSSQGITCLDDAAQLYRAV